MLEEGGRKEGGYRRQGDEHTRCPEMIHLKKGYLL